jgi:uncharacterized protein with beta-barrel porin domain
MMTEISYAGYSLQDVTATRAVTLAGYDTLQGNFAADVASACFEAGYRLPFGLLAMSPMGRCRIGKR